MTTTKPTAADWIARDQRVVQHPGGGGGEHTLVLSHGEGARLWDVDGNSCLDAQGGAWLNKVGYGRTELARVAAAQMEKLACFAFGFDYTNTPAIEFAEALVARATDNLTTVRFETGGGEADDHALQLARIYQAQKGFPNRRKILIHRDAYHGGTLAGVELTGGKPGVLPISEDAIVLTPPRPYHTELYEGCDMVAFCVDELRAVIAEHGAETIAAMFGEIMIGPGGMIPLPDEYWPAITAVLKEHGILFVADEVVTGFGRAGAWFMSREYGLSPDMMVLAKGICSGYVPMAAVLMSDRGLMMGIELVSNKETRAPLIKDAPWLGADLPRYMRRNHGILLGLRTSAILLTPPLVIDRQEVSAICQALKETIGSIDPETYRLPDGQRSSHD